MTSQGVVPVSAIIPTYNRREAVTGAIDSVLAQSAPPAEILVIDDGSTDGTSAFLHQYYGAKVTCIRQSNQGVSAARNAGVAAAGQPFVAFLDSDDLWTPQKLERQYAAMRDDRVVLSATNWDWRCVEAPSQFERIASRPAAPFAVLEDPLVYLARPGGHGIAIQTCVCPRDLLQDMGCFDTRYRITEDNDLIFRLGEKGHFALFPDVMMQRRPSGGEGNLTDTKSPGWKAENLDNMLIIVDARLSFPISAEARRALRRLRGQLAISRARLLAATGATAAARALYFQQFSTLQPTKQTVLAAAGMIAPRLAGKLQRAGR